MEKLSIALKYLPESNLAPEIIASGKNSVAELITKIAKKNNVPIVKDSDTAQILANFPTGSEIPEELYKVVASIFSFVNLVEKNMER